MGDDLEYHKFDKFFIKMQQLRIKLIRDPFLDEKHQAMYETILELIPTFEKVMIVKQEEIEIHNQQKLEIFNLVTERHIQEYDLIVERRWMEIKPHSVGIKVNADIVDVYGGFSKSRNDRGRNSDRDKDKDKDKDNYNYYDSDSDSDDADTDDTNDDIDENDFNIDSESTNYSEVLNNSISSSTDSEQSDPIMISDTVDDVNVNIDVNGNNNDDDDFGFDPYIKNGTKSNANDKLIDSFEMIKQKYGVDYCSDDFDSKIKHVPDDYELPMKFVFDDQNVQIFDQYPIESSGDQYPNNPIGTHHNPSLATELINQPGTDMADMANIDIDMKMDASPDVSVDLVSFTDS